MLISNIVKNYFFKIKENYVWCCQELMREMNVNILEKGE